MSEIPTTMLLPVAAAPAANKVAAVLNVDLGGEHTFEVCRLSPNAQEPATHFGAACNICDDTLPLLYDAAALRAVLIPLAAQRDRECPTQEEIEYAVSSVQLFPNEDAFTVFMQHDLKVVEVPV